jgi:hypothetical protein
MGLIRYVSHRILEISVLVEAIPSTPYCILKKLEYKLAILNLGTAL